MTQTPPLSFHHGLMRHLRRTFGTGLVLVVPAVITYLVLRFLFNELDDILQPGLKNAFGRRIPGLGIILLLALVYLMGLVWANYLGKRVLRMTQNTLLRVPVLNAVYSTVKQFVESFSGERATGFKRVVAIEYPRKGTWTIGFLTGETTDEDGKVNAVVYVPAGPSPHTGFMAIMPMDTVRDTNMSVQEALQFLLSAGTVSPRTIKWQVREP